MYCRHCGAQIADDHVFCAACGARQNDEQVERTQNSANTTYNEGMVCPCCGSDRVQITTEAITTTAGKDFSASKGCLGYLLLGPLGVLCGACGPGKQATTTNSSVWICTVCGERFRRFKDIDADLEASFNAIDAAKKRANVIRYIALGIVIIEIIAISTLIIKQEVDPGFEMLACLITPAILFAISFLTYNSSIKRIRANIKRLNEEKLRIEVAQNRSIRR